MVDSYIQVLNIEITNKIKLIPYYTVVLNLSKISQQNKKKMIKIILDFYDTIHRFQQLNHVQYEKKLIYKLQMYLVSLKYVKSINNKKRTIVRLNRQVLKLIYRRHFFYQLQINLLRIQTLKLIQNLTINHLSKSQKETHNNRSIQLINKKLQKYKHPNFDNLFKLQQLAKNQSIMKQGDELKLVINQNRLQIQNRLKQLFNIKDIKLFCINNNLLHQFSVLYVHQKYNKIPPFYINVNDIVSRVSIIKSTQQFKMSQDVYQILQEILDLQYKYLKHQLKDKHQLKPNHIQSII